MADRYSNPSGNAGNWDTTATWSTSEGGSTGASIPVDGDRAIIVAGDTVTNNGNHHVGSVEIQSGAILNGDGGAIIYLDDDGNANVFQNDGSVTGTPRLHFTNSSSRNVKFGSGTFGIISVEFSSTATLTMTSALTSSGNLSISSNSTLTTSGSNYAITTTGDTTVEGTLTGNASAIELGSLTIASGGTYSATSGTTTITGETGTKCFDNQGGGTFTHNNGTLKFASSIGDTTFDNAGADDFYNLTCETNGDCKYLNAITVLNNLTINHSNANFAANTDGSGAITVHGITRLVLGIAFATSDDNANADHYGFIQVEGGTFRISDTSSATKTCDGIRNIGGTIDG